MIRYRVRQVDLETAEEGGLIGEPFFAMRDIDGDIYVLCREQYFEEADEAKSSTREENFNRAGSEQPGE